MPGQRMHADELAVDVGLVRRLVAAQLPQWAALPLTPVPSAGTINALFRLGDDMVARLPRVEWGVKGVEREHEWLPRLAPHLPVAIPALLGKGSPGAGYPWPWSVFRWLEGENPMPGRIAEPRSLATALAEFVVALRHVDLTDAPTAYRGVPLATRTPTCVGASPSCAASSTPTPRRRRGTRRCGRQSGPARPSGSTRI